MMTSPLPSSSETTELNDNGKLNKSLEHVHTDANSKESIETISYNIHNPEQSQVSTHISSGTNSSDSIQQDYSSDSLYNSSIDIHNSSFSSSENICILLIDKTHPITPTTQSGDSDTLLRSSPKEGHVCECCRISSDGDFSNEKSTTQMIMCSLHSTEPLRMGILNV